MLAASVVLFVRVIKSAKVGHTLLCVSLFEPYRSFVSVSHEYLQAVVMA